MIVSDSTSQIIGARYQEVSKLGEGGMGAVYSVLDRLTGILVALKRVIVPTQQLQFSSGDTETDSRIAITNEFRILASLRHPNIISVLDYGFEANQPFFTMSLLPDPVTILEASRGASTETRLGYITQMLQALSYLHRRGIIHRDLKPANVMVTNDGQVKVLDFGLALAQAYAHQNADQAAGTMAYMAPEVLSGEPVSVASDLYAVGVMVYEIFADVFPYDRTTVTTLLADIMYKEPDVSALDPKLGAVVARLLRKDWRARYPSADETIVALCEAMNYPLPKETLAIRESFLNAAQFVGRDAEMAQLSQLLRAAIGGESATWLIAGESGVGKSRLLSELRVEALVENLLVLQGQEVSEARSPYQGWRDVIRRLVLFSDITDFEAGVLKSVVPNIGRLLERDIPDVPELPPDAEQERFFQAVEKLFQNYANPLLVILEDLHWAGEESLALLNRLTRMAKNSALLILGSFRDDEVSTLPEQVTHNGVIRLARLDREGIAALSASMLGKYGDEPHIIDFLQTETEGNVFFLVEVMRVLADEAGTLDQIARMPLPEKVVASGVVQVLQRRLERIPAEGQSFLQLAALIGRNLDERLLRHMNARALDYDAFLAAANNIAVLTVENEQWRFSHDKLREALVAGIPADARRGYHRQAAEAIEQVYPDSPDWVASLAYHWEQADDPPKAAYYLEQAADQAVSGAAYNQAFDYILRAETFDDRVGELPPLRRVNRRKLKGGAAFFAGRGAESLDYYRDALKHMGLADVPDQQWRLGLGVMKQLTRQTLHRRFPNRFIGRKAPTPEILNLVPVAGDMASVYYVKGDILRTLYLSLMLTNTTEMHQPHPQLSIPGSYAIMTTLTGLIPLPRIAAGYHQRTRQTIDQSDEPGRAGAWLLLGIYDTGVAEFAQAKDEITRAREIYKNIGSQRRWEEATFFLGSAHYFAGEYEQANALLWESVEHGVRRADPIVQFMGSMAIAQVALRQNQLDEVPPTAALLDEEKAEASYAKEFSLNPSFRAQYYALRGLYHLREGKFNLAYDQAAKALTIVGGRAVERVTHLLEAYDSAADVFLTLLAGSNSTALSADRKTALAGHAALACKLMKSYAKILAFAQPRALLREGQLDWLNGKPDAARRKWQSAITAAQGKLPYETGLGYYLVSLNLDKNDPARRQGLQQAMEIFNRIGTPYEASLAEAALT